MVKINKLRGKIVEAGMTAGDLADKSGISRATWYRRISTDGEEFTAKEIASIAATLELSDSDILDIFLAKELHP